MAMKYAIFYEFIRKTIKSVSLKNGENKIVIMLRHCGGGGGQGHSGPMCNLNPFLLIFVCHFCNI